jgi:3-phenylpropionate/trans-cinnamate dioxygenase ferredoxin component
MADNGAIITPEHDGPYHVRGSFRIELPSGRVLETQGETWLCRCGGSQDKPFCDGTHSNIGFKAAESAVAEAEASEGPRADGCQAVADAASVGEGELVGAEVGGQPVVVGRVDRQLYAIGGICSHQYARLADGDLDGTTVMCPLHNSGFDIRTGQPVRLPAEIAVPSYEVREEDGRVLVSMKPRGSMHP